MFHGAFQKSCGRVKMTFHDFHRNEHGQQIYLTLLVPILDGPDYSRPRAFSLSD